VRYTSHALRCGSRLDFLNLLKGGILGAFLRTDRLNDKCIMRELELELELIQAQMAQKPMPLENKETWGELGKYESISTGQLAAHSRTLNFALPTAFR
jgi:hypothetical protein